VLSFLIFFTVGIFQVLIFQESGIRPAYLYTADLCGAALGSLFSFLILNAGGAPNSLIIFSLFLATAGIFIYLSYYSRRRVAAGLLLLSLVAGGIGIFVGFESKLLPNKDWQKEMTVMLESENRIAQILETRWSAFGRVDLVKTENPLFRTMFIDGAAGTKMIEMEGGRVQESLARNLLFKYMGGIPLLVHEKENKNRAAVIGSGGGIDAVTLLLSGYRQIDAVEINPDFIDIVRSYSDYNGGIYSGHPKIDVYEDEGRSFLRAREENYNVILMGLPIIKSARNFSNHSLTENYLFTREAFTDYRASLEEEGHLVIISHYPNELFRLVSNAIASFHDQGLSTEEAMKRIVAIGMDNNPTLIVKNDEFSRAEIAGFQAILENFPVRGTTNYIPGLPQADFEYRESKEGEIKSSLRFNPALYALSRGELDLKGYVAQSDEDISVVRDDSPFFYRMERGLPRELLVVAGSVIVILLAIAALFGYRNRGAIDEKERKPAFRHFLSFMLIGFGFMLVEIGVLQKFIVFWHHQTLALTIVLSVILVSSGIGSFLSSRLKDRLRLPLAAGATAVLSLASVVLLGPILLSMESSATAIKLLVTVLLLTPLFLPMGVPFPSLLYRTEQIAGGKALYPWMIGVNSIATLGGGVLSMILAMSIGYVSVILTGAVCYLLLLAFSLKR